MMAAESKSQLDLPLQKMENYQQMSLSNQGFLFKAIQLANIHMIFALIDSNQLQFKSASIYMPDEDSCVTRCCFLARAFAAVDCRPRQ